MFARIFSSKQGHLEQANLLLKKEVQRRVCLSMTPEKKLFNRKSRGLTLFIGHIQSTLMYLAHLASSLTWMVHSRVAVDFYAKYMSSLKKRGQKPWPWPCTMQTGPWLNSVVVFYNRDSCSNATLKSVAQHLWNQRQVLIDSRLIKPPTWVLEWARYRAFIQFSNVGDKYTYLKERENFPKWYLRRGRRVVGTVLLLRGPNNVVYVGRWAHYHAKSYSTAKRQTMCLCHSQCTAISYNRLSVSLQFTHSLTDRAAGEDEAN